MILMLIDVVVQWQKMGEKSDDDDTNFCLLTYS